MPGVVAEDSETLTLAPGPAARSRPAPTSQSRSVWPRLFICPSRDSFLGPPPIRRCAGPLEKQQMQRPPDPRELPAREPPSPALAGGKEAALSWFPVQALDLPHQGNAHENPNSPHSSNVKQKRPRDPAGPPPGLCTRTWPGRKTRVHPWTCARVHSSTTDSGPPVGVTQVSASRGTDECDHLVTRRSEARTRTTQVTLEDTVLSERSETKRPPAEAPCVSTSGRQIPGLRSAAGWLQTGTGVL